MANFGSYTDRKSDTLNEYIEHVSAKRLNEANRVYERNVDAMFGRLHSNAEGNSNYNSSDYERVAFTNKEDVARFVSDMKEQGITVVHSSRKMLGQYLVEIPREIDCSALNSGSYLAQRMTEANMSSITAADILKDASKRIDISCERPVQTQYMEETSLNHLNGDLHTHLTNKMDDLGKVIDKAMEWGTKLESYAASSKSSVFNKPLDMRTLEANPSQDTGSLKRALVINNETVIIDGKLVTDSKTKESILKLHEERLDKANDHIAEGKRLEEKANNWNEHIHKEELSWKDRVSNMGAMGAGAIAGGVAASVMTGGMAGTAMLAGSMAAGALGVDRAGKSLNGALRGDVYSLDFNNPKAVAEMKKELASKGLDWDDPSKVYKSGNGADKSLSSMTFRNGEEVITVKHKHADPYANNSKLQPIVANSEAIVRNIYKQDYAATGGFKAETFCKDMSLSKSQADLMFSMYLEKPGVFTYKEIQAINSFRSKGEASNLSFAERETFIKKLDKIKKDSGLDESSHADWKEIKNQIKLSDTEKAQKSERDLEGRTTSVRVDFALEELNDIAAKLNTDWHVTYTSSAYKSGLLDVSKYGKSGDAFLDILKRSKELDLTKDQIELLEKISKAKSSGLGDIKLNAMEKHKLSEMTQAYMTKFGSKLTEEEKQSLKAILEGKLCTLNSVEYASVMNMISVRRDLGISVSMANFNADKLLQLNKAFLAKAKLAGVDVFTRKNGRWIVDPEKIKRLSAEQLRKMGISENTRKLMVDINKANPHGFPIGSIKDKIISLAKKGDESGSIAEFHDAVTKIQKGYAYTRSGIVYIRNEARIVKVRRNSKKTSSDYGKSSLKTKTKKKPKNQKKVNPPKPPKVLSAEDFAKRSAKATKAKEKAVKRAAKREKSIIGRAFKLKTRVMTKFANSALGKTLITFKKVTSAALMKFVVIAVAVFFVLTGILIITITAVQAISAFLDKINPISIIDNALAPDTYEDTVAWKLYAELLRPMEEDWMEEDVQDYNAITTDRIHNRYGADYKDFQTYISEFNDLVLTDTDHNGYYSDIAINPFYKDNKPETRTAGYGEDYPGTQVTVRNSYNEDILTSSDHLVTEHKKIKDKDGNQKTVWHYDGEQITTFGANNNVFDKINDGGTYDPNHGYSSIESGHTSNIKDILCMVDVMYGMDLDDSVADLDKGANSILGKSPAQLDWENAVNNTIGFFKWLWNTIKAPFTSAKYEPLKKFCQSHVGYSTVCKYASTLFSDSHQEEIAFEVKYYDTSKVEINTDTGIKDITNNINQEQASVLGYCKNPVNTYFELFWNKNADTPRVSPFFWKNGDETTGIKYPVDIDKKYEVTVTMANLAEDETPCLKADMGQDEATYNYIKNLTKVSKSPMSPCWKQTADKKVLEKKEVYRDSTGGDGWYSGDTSQWNFETSSLTYHEGDEGWYDSEAAAKASAEALLRADYDSMDPPETKYFLDSNRDLFRKTFCEKPAFKVDFSEATIETRDNVLDGGTKEEHVHYDRFTDQMSTDGGTGWGYVLKVWGKDKNGYTHSAEKKVDTDDIGYEHDDKGFWTGDTLHLIIYHPDGEEEHWDTGFPAGGYSWGTDKMTRTVAKYKTQYRVRNAKACLYEQKKDEFQRDCKGHVFTYCGGHICVHSHGVTYSMTNEQIDMIGIQDENSGIPLADGFNMKNNGFDEIRGKVITEKVNYASAKTAASTGGSSSPLFDPQGSASGMAGLNVKVKGEQWDDGYDLRGSTAWHELRDIFDVDCVILKGDNVFPTNKCAIKEYEGWNSDNMTLALMKFCANWYEEYGFDIPQELCHGSLGEKDGKEEVVDGKKVKLTKSYEYGYKGAGQAPLSEDDINKIITALEGKYGGLFTAEREKATRQALGYVGKGHYNELHTHNFLDKACQGLTVHYKDRNGAEGTVTYQGCCTAGDEKAFANFIRHHNGKSVLVNGNSLTKSYTYDSTSYTSNALPADVIVHQATEDMHNIVVPSDSALVTNVGPDAEKRYIVKQIKDNQREKCCVFIGIVGEKIQLSTGQVIQPNIPIVIDLTSMNDKGLGKDSNGNSYKATDGLGNIYLHGIDEGDDYSGKSFAIYSWLVSDTSRTKLLDFE